MTETKIELKKTEINYPELKLGDKIVFDKYPNKIYMFSVGRNKCLVNLESGTLFNSQHDSEKLLRKELIERQDSYRIISELEIKEI